VNGPALSYLIEDYRQYAEEAIGADRCRVTVKITNTAITYTARGRVHPGRRWTATRCAALTELFEANSPDAVLMALANGLIESFNNKGDETT
jgi:hypothetical protein